MSIEAPPLERKLVAILAADVEGYSRMMHADEETTLATLTSRRYVIDNLISAAGGHITGTAGDSVLAEFASVVEAVVCAVEIQRSVAADNALESDRPPMLFRIGINVGDVMVKDGSIFGDGVNVAARVEALAPAGGICVTRGVRDHVRDRLPYRFEDVGDHSVKNISRPVHVYRLVFQESELAKLPAPREAPSLSLATAPAASDVELAFWGSVEAGGTPEELRAYLKRYPHGAFAPIAHTRLEQVRDAEPEVDRTVELAFWDSVKDGEDAALFEAYLQAYPDGAFRSIAEIRIGTLRASSRGSDE